MEWVIHVPQVAAHWCARLQEEHASGLAAHLPHQDLAKKVSAGGESSGTVTLEDLAEHFMVLAWWADGRVFESDKLQSMDKRDKQVSANDKIIYL